ncbi:glycosyltransferase [Marinobacter litoralis]|uniref:glycosyltransferase n=1 Tax=Marinobacter litoralis TaxID=187981 RepID=UPI0018EA8F32|nr:glycosyltransferase [Marinobacter litoralis]MBJ6137691.1 hypothetical protein [Marinobacter litoralis]
MNIDKDKKCIFLSWEIHTRSRSISRELGVPIFEVVHDNFFLIRYYRSIIETFRILKKEKPNIVIFQNPSIVLAVFILVYSRFSKLDLVMDAHNAAIFPLEGKFWLLNKLCSVLISKVKLTIITNQFLIESIKDRGGRPFVLEDPIPKLDVSKGVKTSKGKVKKLVFVCSWAKDEPYMEVMEAFKSLSDKDVMLFVTGRPPEYVFNKPIPNNVKLTGFLSEQDYIDLLAGSNLIIDLTNRPDCLVCGGYEAAAVGTPCIISNNLCSSDTFSKGYVYSENDSGGLKDSILYAIDKEDALKSDIEWFRGDYEVRYHKKIEALKDVIYHL